MMRPGRAASYFCRASCPHSSSDLMFDGVGEMIGYAFGPGAAMAKLSDMEFHRERFLAAHDRRETAAEPQKSDRRRGARAHVS